MRRIALLALLLSAVCAVTQTQGPRIGLLMADLNTHERWQTDVDLFTKRAAELGATVAVRDGHGDHKTQLEQARDILSSVDVLVLNPEDAVKSGAIVEMAHAAHVPVVCYDRLALGSRPDLYISYDSEKVGELQASYLLKMAPSGNYVLIGGAETDNNAHLIHDGQMKVLGPAIASGKIKIALDRWSENWRESAAYMNMRDALAKTKEVAAVLAANDEAASGATQAITEAGMRRTPVISGQDADLSAVVRIIRGSQSMTVYKPIAPLARITAESAVGLAVGEVIKASTTVKDGTADIPALLLEPRVVDRQNLVQTVFADRFQNADVVKSEVTAAQWQSVMGVAVGK